MKQEERERERERETFEQLSLIFANKLSSYPLALMSQGSLQLKRPLCKNYKQPRVKMRESDAKYLLQMQAKKHGMDLELDCMILY